MVRTGLLITAIAVACYVLIHLIVTTDRERVEAEVERLLELARSGGEDAADEILAAFADDYRGTIPLKRIAAFVRDYVGASRIVKLTTGSYKTFWDGDEIRIPILALYITAKGWEAKTLLTVVCAERDGEWKIVEFSRLRWG